MKCHTVRWCTELVRYRWRKEVCVPGRSVVPQKCHQLLVWLVSPPWQLPNNAAAQCRQFE